MSEDFPDDPVVKTLPSSAEGASLTPEQGTVNPHALQPKHQKKKKKKKKHRSNSVTNSMKALQY